jgi:hypothetical protein
MGHAYYWVAHRALSQEYKNVTYFKGVGWHPTKGLTGKAWSNDLDETTRAVIALVSRAADHLQIGDKWSTWFRSKESFLGREVKKSLPTDGTEILTRVEKDYLLRRETKAVQEYKNLLEFLEQPTSAGINALPARIKDVGRSLQPLCEAVDRTIGHRLSSAYPTNRKDRAKARRRPIKEVLSELGPLEYIFVMDPLVLAGSKPFRVDYPEDRDISTLNWDELRKSYHSRIGPVERSSPELAEIARAFCETNFWVGSTEIQD